MRKIESMRRENAFAQNRRNSFPCTVRTSEQRLCNQRAGCLQFLGSIAFESAKRLLSTFPLGMIRMYEATYISYPVHNEA